MWCVSLNVGEKAQELEMVVGRMQLAEDAQLSRTLLLQHPCRRVSPRHWACRIVALGIFIQPVDLFLVLWVTSFCQQTNTDTAWMEQKISEWYYVFSF